MRQKSPQNKCDLPNKRDGSKMDIYQTSYIDIHITYAIGRNLPPSSSNSPHKSGAKTCSLGSLGTSSQLTIWWSLCTLEPLMTAVKGSNAGVEALMTLPLVKRLEPAPHVISSGRRFRLNVGWIMGWLGTKQKTKTPRASIFTNPSNIFSGGSYDISYIYR